MRRNAEGSKNQVSKLRFRVKGLPTTYNFTTEP